MADVFVSIGSNIDRENNVRRAIAVLRDRFGRMRISPVYESPAVGFHGDPFLNLVVRFESGAAPQDLAGQLLEIERAHGRRRGRERFVSRTLDLDLLLYGDHIIRDGSLRIPRDDIVEYAFVLRPLAELAPDVRHPEIGESFSDLWRRANGAGLDLVRIELPLES